jgi:predicted TIM-barrel fold metal-dependent hydrolase
MKGVPVSTHVQVRRAPSEILSTPALLSSARHTEVMPNEANRNRILVANPAELYQFG